MQCLLFIISLIWGYLLLGAYSQPNPDVCIPGPVTPSEKTRPTLPDQFSTQVELTNFNKEMTLQTQEVYDGINNRGAAIFLVDGKVEYHTYDYRHSQHIEVHDGVCTVTNMTNTTIMLFGFHYENGEGHINSVSDIFDFGNGYNDSFIGTEMIRGIPVDHWRGCVYKEYLNMTLISDLYFSAAGYTMPSGDKQVLVRMTINGTVQNVTDDGKLIPDAFTNIAMSADYFSFEKGPARDEFVFQVPQGHLCPGRKSTSPMPLIPKQFSARREIVKMDQKKVHYFEEQFDAEAKLVRYYFIPNNDTSVTGGHWNPYDFDPVEIIHDYNTGIGYIIDPVNLNCSMMPIYKFSSDSQSQPDGSITMSNATTYLELENAHWVYEGKAIVRDIECHAWIAKRTDWPKMAISQGYEVNSTWEYFFTDLEWTADGSKMSSEKGRPVRVEIQATWKLNDTINTTHEVHNIYHFMKTSHEVNLFDIQNCYKPKETKMLAFMFNGTNLYNTVVLNNTRQFTTDVRNAIANYAKVSALRVVDVFADDVKGHLKVWFSLLDKPHIMGDVTGVLPQNNLTVAYNNLMNAINRGIMKINVMYKQSTHTLTVRSKSLVEDGNNPIPPQPPADIVHKGYSSGAMVGLAIAMIVVGGALGLGVGFYLWKHNKGFSYQVQE